MGADLVSYIVVGPVELKPSKAVIKKVLDHAEHIVVAAQQAVKDPNFDWVDNRFISHFDDVEVLAEVALVEHEALLKDLMDLWAGRMRDTACRVIKVSGKKLQVVVAGEMTWGDEPSGEGYRTLRDADRLGMLKGLGIQ